ncbi:DUF6223 family protein [Streptomyces sp. NPDC086783]
MALAVLHLAASSGGFGTGNGRAGAVVALLLAPVALVLGGLVVRRTHRTG